MARPRQSKPKSKRERAIADGVLPFDEDGATARPAAEETAYIPLSEAPGVDPVDPAAEDASVEAEAEGPPEGPIPRASLAHSVPQQPGTNWYDLTIDQRMAAFDKARQQNRDADHSNEGGPETVEVGNATHINYLRRTR